MLLKTPRSVFVPFELQGRKEIKRDDLPRFIEPEEIIQYLTNNPGISHRNGHRVLIEWREHSERDLIDEYIAGVGTSKFRRH